MRVSTLALAGSVAACSLKRAPATVAPRDPTPISASAGRTLDAVADEFASRRIPIRTLKPASGLIATDQLGLGQQQGQRWADCGRVLEDTPTADRVSYNVVVRGDSAASTVKVAARWTQDGVPDHPQSIECSTKDVLESELEAAIKLGAESQVPRVATAVSASADRTWDAVLDVFASSGIPVRMIERGSGFIATGGVSLDRHQARKWSEDCGWLGLFSLPPDADAGSFNVLVRGDSTASTVKVTARWTAGGYPSDRKLLDCSTTRVRERELEAAIKQGAEAP